MGRKNGPANDSSENVLAINLHIFWYTIIAFGLQLLLKHLFCNKIVKCRAKCYPPKSRAAVLSSWNEAHRRDLKPPCLQNMKVRIAWYETLRAEIMNWCHPSGVLWTQILEMLLYLGVCQLASLHGRGANAVLDHLQRYCRFFWMQGACGLPHRWVTVANNASKCPVSCLWIVPVCTCDPLPTISRIVLSRLPAATGIYYVDCIFYSLKVLW